nr:MAG TPA: tail tape measure protein [Caudoviricetes sp.]
MIKPVEIEFLVKNNTRQGLSGVSGGIEGVEKSASAAQKRIQALEAEIARLHKVMAETPKMDQTENIRQIETLQREIQALQNTAKKTDLMPVNAPAVQRTYNGLNMSIQQMARELPSLTMGLQMFFMAISNNWPIFADNLARARKEYDLLTASGQKATPVWKQVLSSIGSFQTLLAVGITLAVVYGKEIGNFVSSLFRGKNAFDAAARSAEAFHATMLEGSKNAQSEVVKLNLLYRAATDNARAMDERLEATKRLKDEYPDYFKNLSDEQIMVGKASDAYKSLVANIYEYAKAQAAFKSMVDLEQQRQMFDTAANIEQYKKAYDRYLKAQEDVAAKRKIYEATPWAQRGNASEPYRNLTWAETLLLNARREMEDLQKQIFEEVKKYEGGEEIIDEIKERFNGNLGAFLQFIAEQRTKLAAIAEKAQLNDNPTSSPGGGNKQPNNTDPVDQLGEQYQAAILKQRQELSELSVAAMQEGADKERAQIRLEYEKKRQQYEDEERKMLALIKKLRASGADVDPGAEKQVMAFSAAATSSAAQLRDKQLAEVDKKEEATYEKLLQKYETYQQGRLRLAQKYDADIAKLAADPQNQEVAQQAKQKALDEFDVKFASQFPQFEAWADRIVAASVEKLKTLLSEAQAELEALENDPTANNGAVAVARAKVVELKSKLEKSGNEDPLAPDDQSIKKWQDLQEVLRDASNEFEQIGNQVGGTGGEILQLAGQISTSIITMIGGIQTMANAAAISISNVEKASVILTIIAAAVQVITAVAGLFSDQESSMERNLRLAREFNEELRIMKERSKIDSDAYDSIFGDRLYDRYKQNVEAVRTALDGLSETQEQIMTRGKEVFDSFSKGSTGLANLDKVAKTWETVADSVYNMRVQTRHSTWFRSAKYKSLGSLVPELFDDGELNMEALKEFVENGGDTFKHLSDANRKLLQSLVDDWETYEEAIGAVNDYLQDIFGDLGNTLTDALVDAFENGTDAAESFVESVGQAMRKLAKDMIYSNTIGQAFEDAQRRFDEINRENGLSDEERFAKWSDAMQQLVSDAMGQQDDFNRLWAEFRRIAAEAGLSIDDIQGTSQSGKAGAVNTVTQEAFSRVEGLVTSIQIHEANVDRAVEEGIVPVLGRSLEALNRIRINTDTLPLMYEMLAKFDREGIKVK